VSKTGITYLVNIIWDPIDVRSILMTWFKWKAWWWPHRGRNI